VGVVWTGCGEAKVLVGVVEKGMWEGAGKLVLL